MRFRTGGRRSLPESGPWIFARSIFGRLSERQDSEHEQATIRLIIVAVLVLYFLILGLAVPESGLPLFDAALFAGVYLGVSLGFVAWIVLSPAVNPVRRVCAMIGDHGTLCVLSALGGPWGAAMYPIHLWVTFGNGLRYGNRYLIASASVSLIGFIVAAFLSPFWSESWGLVGGLALGLVALPGYLATLIAKLMTAKQTAEAANRAKSRFIATMSHELRTPLNAVIGLSDLLRSSDLNAEQREMVETIGRSGRGLLAQISDVLDFAKIEAGQLELNERAFAFAPEMAGVLDIMRAETDRRGLTLSLVIDADVPDRVEGDLRYLRQIVLNLLGNAVKFTEQGGIAVCVRQASPATPYRLVIEVADTGPGISESDQARIFEAFRQTDRNGAAIDSGSGLGLTIARQLAGLMGGGIELSSSVGAGSIFAATVAFRAPSDLSGDPGLGASQGDLPASIELVRPEGNPESRVSEALCELGIACAPDGDDTGVDERLFCLDASAPQSGADRTCGAVMAPIGGEVSKARAGLLVTASGETGRCLALGGAVKAVRVDPCADAALVARALRTAGRMRQVALPEAPPASARRADRAQPGVGSAKGAAGPQGPAPRGERILVVEDNEVNAMVMRKVLERQGLTPVIVTCADDALAALEGASFDLILMDVNMPGHSGIEVVKLYRFMEGARRVPVIAVTAYATAETREECLEAGMDDFLTKPFETGQLVALINRYLGGPDTEAGAVGKVHRLPVRKEVRQSA